MMMVLALRPKMTRNNGYISTVGADAMAATQVSVAWRRMCTRCSSTPRPTPNTVMRMVAQNASRRVSQKRAGMSSSTIDPLERERDLRGQGDDVAVDQADADQELDQQDPTQKHRNPGQQRERPRLRQRRHRLIPAQLARLVLVHAAARLFAQVAPNLRDVAAERLADETISDVRGRGRLMSMMRFTLPGR